MATWVEDIVQALKNLGGQAHRKEILEEIRRIRSEPLPNHALESMQERIQAYSSDSEHFRGIDLFKKIGNGVWALRDVTNLDTKIFSNKMHSEDFPTRKQSSITMELYKKSTWVEDIVQALTNLGGQATNSQICEEVQRIRQQPLPKTWESMVMSHIYNNTNDNPNNPGEDLFRWVDKGVWALQSHIDNAQPVHKSPRSQNVISQNLLPPNSFEEIENILRTIKQYRDYQDPNSQTWNEYIKEIFHIFGFSTEDINPRLIALKTSGVNQSTKALVGMITPGENFEEIIPGVSWESHMLYATKYHNVRWGILTDGLQLKIIDYLDKVRCQNYYFPEFDIVICNERNDTFFTIYKNISHIKNNMPEDSGDYRRNNELGMKNNQPESHSMRIIFWRQLLEKAKTKIIIHANISPGIDNWLSAGAGKSYLQYTYEVRSNDAQVHLYFGHPEANINKSRFKELLQYKSEIELCFGESLDWQLLPDKRACRIRYLISGYGLKDEDHWDELQDRMIDYMVRFERAFSPFIQRL